MTAKVLEIGGYAAAYAGRLFVNAGFDVVRFVTPPKPAWASQAAMDAFLNTDKRQVTDQFSNLVNAADIVERAFNGSHVFVPCGCGQAFLGALDQADYHTIRSQGLQGHLGDRCVNK